MRNSSLNAQIALLTFIRTVINTSYRMVYPLLPVFARGLGIDLTTVSYVFSARSTFGMASILLAPLADRFGRRISMVLGLLIFIAGSSVVIFLPTFTGFWLGLVLTNIAMQIFIPPMQAYLADRIHYSKLGRAIGITETSWALAFIFGIPAVTWLVGRAGWSAPFPLLAGLGVLSLALVVWMIPSDRPHGVEHPELWRPFVTALRSPAAWLALAFCLTLTVANEVVNMVFGVWMEDSFGLQLAALGAASLVIGLSELGGSSITAGIVDRVGKRRGVAAGLALNAVAAVILPALGGSLTWTLIGLFFFYLTFEITIVSVLPMMAELVPNARATMMALVIASFGGGRALGALLGPVFYDFGFWGNALAATVLNLVALLMLARIHLPEEDRSG